MQPYTTDDFGVNPLMFYYEVTRACDLQCKHCRASAQHEAAPDELTHEQSIQLIDQVATFPRKPNMASRAATRSSARTFLSFWNTRFPKGS